jgi:hypothetical protein
MKNILRLIFYLIIFSVFFSLLSGCGVDYSEENKKIFEEEKKHFFVDSIQYENNMIAEQSAIEIANKKMVELGYDIKSMRVLAAIRNKPWNYLLKKEFETEYAKKRKEQLTNKIYWEVFYTLKERILSSGGYASIYIDAKSGKIITYGRGK